MRQWHLVLLVVVLLVIELNLCGLCIIFWVEVILNLVTMAPLVVVLLFLRQAPFLEGWEKQVIGDFRRDRVDQGSELVLPVSKDAGYVEGAAACLHKVHA